MREDLTAAQVRTARAVAAAADLVQVVLMPAFFPGAASPANDVIDVAVALVLLRLVGFHWAFLPAFLAEAVPVLDLAPTWTAAVFLATRSAVLAPEPVEVVVEKPAPPAAPRALPPSPDQAPRGPSGA
ncbi:MAG: hypothetical protein U0599_18905 [Vicinamibacteria bacterium]